VAAKITPPLPSLEAAKWLAAALMLLDHVAYIFFPEELLLRLPGRAVFPFFAALVGLNLARGVPAERYLRRLIPFALLAQGGYALAFGYPLLYPLNVLFTLASGVLLYRGSWLSGGLLSLLSESPLGGFAVLAFARGMPLVGTLLIAGTLLLFGWPLPYAAAALLSGLLAYLLVPRLKGPRLTPWWSFYAFYALHLWALAGARAALGGP